MPRLQVVITEGQETVLNAQAAAIGVALKEPVSVPDLIRMWIDQGCHMQPPRCGPQTSQTALTEPPRTAGLPVVDKERTAFLKAGGKLL